MRHSPDERHGIFEVLCRRYLKKAAELLTQSRTRSLDEREAERGERRLWKQLGELLGPDRSGVTAYGLRFDPKRNSLFIGVDLDPDVPRHVAEQIPSAVGRVPVRVRRLTLHLEHGS